MIPRQQHGFVSHKGTLTNLLEHTQFLHSQLRLGKQVDVIYFDYSKAFDQVDHYILLSKLARLATPLSLLQVVQANSFPPDHIK